MNVWWRVARVLTWLIAVGMLVVCVGTNSHTLLASRLLMSEELPPTTDPSLGGVGAAGAGGGELDPPPPPSKAWLRCGCVDTFIYNHLLILSFISIKETLKILNIYTKK